MLVNFKRQSLENFLIFYDADVLNMQHKLTLYKWLQIYVTVGNQILKHLDFLPHHKYQIVSLIMLEQSDGYTTHDLVTLWFSTTVGNDAKVHSFLLYQKNKCPVS